MKKKREIIRKISPDYLKKVTLAMHNSPKYIFLSKTKEELIKYYESKYTIKQLNDIRQYFVLNKSPLEVASKLRDNNGKELARMFVNILKMNNYKLEFKVDNKFCDLVFLDTDMNINAVEIKANGDKIINAKEQTRNYSKWANKVWLLIEKKKIKELLNISLDENIGIIIFSDGKFKVKKSAIKIDHTSQDYINLLTLDRLKFLAYKFGLKKNGTKDELRIILERRLKTQQFIGEYDNTNLIKTTFVSY